MLSAALNNRTGSVHEEKPKPKQQDQNDSSVLMMLTGVSYFAVYMKKRKNNNVMNFAEKFLFWLRHPQSFFYFSVLRYEEYFCDRIGSL
ncbi:hypothetical protein ACSLGF_11645 [Bacillus sp. A015]